MTTEENKAVARRFFEEVVSNGSLDVVDTLCAPNYRLHATLSRFYLEATTALAERLDNGRDVALLAEGDPLFYGSFMHLFVRLREKFDCEIVPGVTGMAGCSAAAQAPMTWGDDVLHVDEVRVILREVLHAALAA